MHKLGVIVPYRNRPEQLLTFKRAIKEYLNKNNILNYELIVVDQVDRKDFNRGKLLNIGFNKAVELGCDYVAFHDVDMLPIQADYSYTEKPVHLIKDFELPAGTSRTLNYDYFGGVTLFPINLFKQINGYSNNYRGWAFEDDDLLLRCKENHIDLLEEEIAQYGRTDIGSTFNGKDSYVALKNLAKNNKQFTIFVSFEIDDLNPNKYKPSDLQSIVSFPGFDTALTYTSFYNFQMTFWNNIDKSVSLKSSKFPEGKYIAAIRYSRRDDGQFSDISLFINGKLIDKNEYAKNLSHFTRPEYLIIGAGNPDRKDKGNWFKGTINNFAFYDTAVNDRTITRISRDSSFFLFDKSKTDNLKVYYDFKYIRGNEIIDLSGHENHGYAKNLKPIKTYRPLPLMVPRPYRRNGIFKVLPHKENGYKDGLWVTWSSRMNQIKYFEKYRNHKTNYQKDGLTSLHYKLYNDYNEPDYNCTTLQVNT